MHGYRGGIAAALVSCPRDSCAKSGDAHEDVIRCGCPDERLGVLVVCIEELGDGLFQSTDATERAASDRLGRDFGEEALDEVQPR